MFRDEKGNHLRNIKTCKLLVFLYPSLNELIFLIWLKLNTVYFRIQPLKLILLIISF
jgi:hypothetical protein